MSWYSGAMGGFDSVSNAALSPIGSIFGGNQQAAAAMSNQQAQTQIANQQLAAEQSQFSQQTQFQEEQYQNQLQSRTTATNMAAPSASELAQMGVNLDLQSSAINYQMSALDRDNKILDSIDPAIKEAGTQALQLMNGQNASILGPLQKQQQTQRTQLEQKLASSLGPDYATSSAGSAALASFDNNAAMTTASAQSQSLGQLLGVVTSANMNPVGNASNAFSSLQGLNQSGFSMAQGLVNQQVNAFEGSPVNQQVAFNTPSYGNLFTAAGNTGNAKAIQGQAQGQGVGAVLSSVAAFA